MRKYQNCRGSAVSGRQAGAGCAASTAAALLQEGGNIEGNMTENEYIAVDLETTGLNPKEDRILEIGALLVRDGVVQEEFQRLVNPCCLLGETTVQITGITDEMAAGGAELKAAMEEFLDFCGDLPLLGHRVLFDYRFLKRAAVNLGHSFERSGMDTLELCRRFMPAEEKKNLQDACRYFGIASMGSHRALWDAWSAHFLYQELAGRYRAADEKPFLPKPLIYKVKREQPASKRQKERLQELLKYHKIKAPVQLDSLTRNEASRLVDKITAKYGRI